MAHDLLMSFDEDLKDLYVRLNVTKNLIFDGKYIQAHNKLQGAITKCISMHKALSNELATENITIEVPNQTDGSG
jgi:hypothetical protein